MSKQTSEIADRADLTDRDLMAYFDDELDEAEIEALEAALEDQEEAQAKLFGLGLAGDLLRERVDADDRADGIADAVMAKLDEADEDEEGKQEDQLKLKELPLQNAPVTASPANDNSRTLWTLAAAAAAVAAGLFVWGNGAPDAEPTALTAPPAAVEAPAETVAPAPETLGEVATATAQEGVGSEEDEDAVEIAQLDFGEGEQTGSIFKVDNASTGVHTAVVWVTDLEDDE